VPLGDRPAPGRELQDFFSYIYGDQEGYVYAPTRDPEQPDPNLAWEQAFFEWPKERGELVKHIQHSTVKKEVFYGPALFTQPSSKKEYVKGTYVYWCEFDGNAPTNAGELPAPTLRIRSSEPGHEHWYWKLDRFVHDIIADLHTLLEQIQADGTPIKFLDRLPLETIKEASQLLSWLVEKVEYLQKYLISSPKRPNT
jgi:hypothetical protein